MLLPLPTRADDAQRRFYKERLGCKAAILGGELVDGADIGIVQIEVDMRGGNFGKDVGHCLASALDVRPMERF